MWKNSKKFYALANSINGIGNQNPMSYTKTCELDEIPIKYIKQCLDECIGIITVIKNVSSKERMFFATWKTAVVRPLFKKAVVNLLNSNYRPVSNLNFPSKVVGKLALVQFNDHCTKFHLYADYVSAFCQYDARETALTHPMEY